MPHDQPPFGPPTPADFEMVEAGPGEALRGVVTRMTGYREKCCRHMRQMEAASLTIPMIISFGDPFAIALGRTPGSDDAQASFVAGLFAGPVVIDSFGASHCLQIDFTPLGARRFLGAPLREFTGRMVELNAALGPEVASLREQLGNEPLWPRRFALARAFIGARLTDTPEPASPIVWAYEAIQKSGGARSITGMAKEIGWSRKHFAGRFNEEIGLGPKGVSRIVRINRALHRARATRDGWADIAADCGFADQAHLAREFRDLAGETPNSWRRRFAAT